jgi:hypothetical protein
MWDEREDSNVSMKKLARAHQRRWQEAIAQRKGKLRPLEASMDLDEIFFIHLQRKAGKVYLQMNLT